MRFWFVQEISKEEGLLKFLCERCDDLRKKSVRRHALIREIEALGDRERQPFPDPIGPQRGMMSCYGRLNFEYWVNDATSNQEPLVKEILSEEANILSKVLRKRIVAKLKVSKFVTKCLKQFDNKMNLSSPCIPFFEQVVVGKFEQISK
ncbi:hypothetical protein Tco_0140950 [Tanacetum coccineum]